LLQFDYDFVVVGGGSGGLACAKRAASYGAKVAVIEGNRWGGTCVNVGCVPKKVMFNTAHVAETLHEAKEFGFTIGGEITFDWGKLKLYRDRYIKRLNGIYEGGLDKLNIARITGMAAFDGPHRLLVDPQDGSTDKRTVTAEHILIAVGGTPKALGIPGDEYIIDSNGFFDLETQPKKVAVLGAGYIAVELAGVLHGLGSDTSLLVRGGKALRAFDATISDHLDSSMKKAGIKVVSGATAKSVTKEADGSLTIALENGDVLSGFDCILAATGRTPLTKALNLPSVSGIATTTVAGTEGYIEVGTLFELLCTWYAAALCVFSRLIFFFCCFSFSMLLYSHMLTRTQPITHIHTCVYVRIGGQVPEHGGCAGVCTG
jgi:glutathione reductase (NADPH)